VASLSLKLKTRLKIIARVKHASLFSPIGYEENRFLTLPPGEIGEEEKKVKIEGKQTR
jgi:hypothetical protein